MIPGRGPNGGIVTTQSTAKAIGSGAGGPAAVAAAEEADGPTTIIVEQQRAGRRLAAVTGVKAVKDVAAVDQDVFVVMQFAASCYTMCE
jgi:Na+-transporting methylmalonyl-CoA/oxaloacetate decarboxylase beta subunit